MNWSELIHLVPIGVVLATALVVVFLDLVLSHADRYAIPWIALTGCILGIVATFQTPAWRHAEWFLSSQSADATRAGTLMLGGAFCLDTFGLSIWLVACLAGALSILCSSQPGDDSALSTGEYYGLTLLAVAGMMLLAISHDFLTLLLSLEIMSISTYILTGSNRDDLRSNEAALKYLVLGAFSTAFLLMGIAFYYGAFGSLSLSQDAAFENLSATNLQEAQYRQLFVIIGMGFILVGALFKIGASPFHFWIPDVYEGAPTPTTGLMAVGVKAAAFAVLARLTFETFGAVEFREMWTPLLRTLAVLTMAIGNILAIRQTNVKRMLAYSGIAHTGYLLLAFLILPANNDSAMMTEHLKSVVFYLLIYGIMTIGAFGVISLVREDGRALEDLDSYTGLAKEHPAIALCMSIFMLSLAGMPPLGGFIAKFLIFRGAILQDEFMAATLGILTSVVSLYYYLRVMVAMYMSPSNATDSADAVPAARCRYNWPSNMLIYAAGALTLALGIFPGLIEAVLSL